MWQEARGFVPCLRNPSKFIHSTRDGIGTFYSNFDQQFALLAHKGQKDQDFLGNKRRKCSNISVQERMRKFSNRIFSTSLLTVILWMAVPSNQPAIAVDTATAPETTMILTTEPQPTESMSQQESLMKSLRPATEERPQIPLPTMSPYEQQPSKSRSTSKYYQNMDSSSTNPQILQTLLSLASPRTVRPYGTDTLIVKVWSGIPPSYKGDAAIKVDSSSSALLGGAKLPLAVVGGGGFPLRITLGPQNAIDAAQWKQYTQSSPQDLWLEAGICRSMPYEDDDASPPQSKQSSSAAASSELLCPSKSNPVLEGVAVSKWIVLPSTEADPGMNAGVRAPSTVQLQ
jgi:hypothetical protein